MSYILNNSWRKFVLNEGIMPAPLVRLIKNDDEIFNNAKLLAQILKMRESFNDTAHPELSELAQKTFLNDEEINNWLASMDSILDIIINFADGDSATNDVLKGAFISFIKSCPLVSEKNKNTYIETPAIHLSSSSYRKKSGNQTPAQAKRDSFMEYLDIHAPKHYSGGTRFCYKTAVNLTSGLIKKDLWDIDDPQEMQEVLNRLIYNEAQTPEEKELQQKFEDKDKATKRSVSCGLQRYYEFLKFRAMPK